MAGTVKAHLNIDIKEHKMKISKHLREAAMKAESKDSIPTGSLFSRCVIQGKAIEFIRMEIGLWPYGGILSRDYKILALHFAATIAESEGL